MDYYTSTSHSLFVTQERVHSKLKSSSGCVCLCCSTNSEGAAAERRLKISTHTNSKYTFLGITVREQRIENGIPVRNQWNVNSPPTHTHTHAQTFKVLHQRPWDKGLIWKKMPQRTVQFVGIVLLVYPYCPHTVLQKAPRDPVLSTKHPVGKILWNYWFEKKRETV